MRWQALLAVSILALPAVTAAPVEGTFTLQGIRFENLASAALRLHALYTNDTRGATQFDLVAERVEIRVWRAEDVQTRLTQPGVSYRVETKEDPVRVLRNARIALDGGAHDGWLGLRRPSEAEATLRAGARIEFSPYSELGRSENRMSDTESPGSHYFMEPLRGPHLLVGEPDALRIDGDGILRVAGLDLLVESGGNRTTLHTGISREEGPVGRARIVWTTISFTNGTLRADGLGPTRAQALGARVTWTGPATLLAPHGALHEADRTWRAEAEDAIVTGTFRATLEPGDDAIRTALEGDLAVSTLRSVPSAPSPAGLAPALPWLGLALGLVAGGAAAYALARRRRAAPEPATEDLLDLALQASEAGDHDRALAWIRRARTTAPGSERVAIEEAAILAAAGREDEALEAYRAVANATGSGEACWLLARGLAQRGAHADDVAPWIVRAMERDPHLAMEIQEDDALTTHVARGDVRAALDVARRKL